SGANSCEPPNATELLYAQERQQKENESLQSQLTKMEGDIYRMRGHLEKESERVAQANEAARTKIQNKLVRGVGEFCHHGAREPHEIARSRSRGRKLRFRVRAKVQQAFSV
ncbi:MAG: hypothetical protein AB8B50_13060, partial [Pirellulaceae bacterium]